MKTYLFLFSASFLITYLLTPVVCRVADRLGVLDKPDGRRKLHANPIARLGGVSIFLGVVLALLPLLYVKNLVGWRFLINLEPLKAIFFPICLVLLVGAYDDVRPLSPWVKLGVEVFAAFWVCSEGISIAFIGRPFGGTIQFGHVISYLVTIAWLIGITNAFNLVDGMDGLATGVAFFAALAILTTSFMHRELSLIILTLPLAGALLAFLRYNFYPARIFLGDSGSLTLGFAFGCLAIIWSQKSTTLTAIVGALVALGLPLTEVGTTILRRFIGGRPLFRPDSEHIHHSLLRRGLPIRGAVLILYVAAALFGIFSVFLSSNLPGQISLGFILLVVFVWRGVGKLGYFEFNELGTALRRVWLNPRHIIATHIQLEKLGDQLERAESGESAWRALVAISRTADFDAVRAEEVQDGCCVPLRMHIDAETEEELRLHPDLFWSLSIPVKTPQGAGNLVFLRRLDRRSPILIDAALLEILRGRGASSLTQICSPCSQLVKAASA